MMPTELSFPPDARGQDPDVRQCLIYFFTGNPGLIDYYEPFFKTLRGLLDGVEDGKKPKVVFHIYGRNLAGFDDSDHEPFTADRPPHDVEYEIQDAFKHLSAMRISQGPRKGEPFDEVILMGHSLGTYIALEIFHRHLHDPELAPHLNLKAGILLFATVAHIAKSSKGVQLDMIRRMPLLRSNVHRIAKGLLSLLPSATIHWFIRNVMGFAPHAAAATTRFLTSRDGVWQALHLGMDEMEVITEEKWTEELWEIEDEALAHQHEVPKFFIFFGKNDHWVANEVRDEFIKKRDEHAQRVEAPKHKRGRTRIVVDEGNLPHDFCIGKSRILGWHYPSSFPNTNVASRSQ